LGLVVVALQALHEFLLTVARGMLAASQLSQHASVNVPAMQHVMSPYGDEPDRAQGLVRRFMESDPLRIVLHFASRRIDVLMLRSIHTHDKVI
jgi:hypothetical protein